MPLFEVTTQSTFENVYLIEASSEDQAVARVLDSYTAPNFFQKHLGEGMRRVIEISDENTAVSDIRTRGYE